MMNITKELLQISNLNNSDSSIEYKNTLSYDEYGRIKSVSDLK